MLTLWNFVVSAQDQIKLQPDSASQFSKLGTLTVPDIVSGFIKMSLVVAALIFFFVLVIGGIRWILSGGDKANTEAARSQITAALVGLVVVFAAWAIVQLIQTFFGINIFTLTLPKAG